jgi:GxxExxY protein
MTLALNTITSTILDAAIFVHRELGPGLLESVYQECLYLELTERGLKAEQFVSIPIQYRGEFLGKHFTIDILVEDSIVLELKAVEKILPVHEAQLISYLKIADKQIGLLINFNEKLLKDGFKRFVNKFAG